MSFSENALFIMKKFYFKKDKEGNLLEKKPEDLFNRVSDFIVQAEQTQEKKSELKKQLFEIMMEQKFMFSSPTLFNAGTDFPLASSCFVGKLEDDMRAIMKAATDTAITFKAGAGMGLNFGTLRPKGAPVGRGGTSSGPTRFMHLFDEVGETVKSGGVRRAAFMAMMDVNHPDIEAFISSKDYVANLKSDNPNLNIPDTLVEDMMGSIGEVLGGVINNSELLGAITYDVRKTLFEPLSNMNISVAVTDRFMKSVRDDSWFELDRHKDKGVSKKVVSKELFHKIAQSAWRTADPGVWFIDRANEFDTVPSIGRIDSTNPCGEQSLHNYTSCNLGSINLIKFVNDAEFDEKEFKRIVSLATRALDNVIDVAEFPTEDFTENTRKIRPIGLGYTGLAEAMFKLGISYNSEEGYSFASYVSKLMTQTAIETSIELAADKGSFELFEENKDALIRVVKNYFDSKQDKKRIESLILEKGIRNSNWTTLAPTGTISLILDAYTYSLEPQFALAYNKNLIDGGILTYVDPEFEKAINHDQDIIQKVVESGGSCQHIESVPEEIKKLFVVAHDIHHADRIKMQAAIQKYISNSISSTINLPSDVTIEEIENIYLKAWEQGLKGITIYRDGCKYFQPMTTSKTKKTQEISLNTKDENWVRPKTITGQIVKTKTGSGTLYTSIGLDENEMPVELFINISKHGSEISAFSEALGRVISIALQHNVPVESLAETIIGIIGDKPTWDNGKLIKSIPDAIGRILKAYSDKLKERTETSSLFENEQIQTVSKEIDYKDPVEIPGAEICPHCGEKAFVRTEDCYSCLSCGYSKCG